MDDTSNNVNTTECFQATNSTDTPWMLDSYEPNATMLTVHTICIGIKILQLIFGTVTNIITIIVICKTEKLRTARNQLLIALAIGDAVPLLGKYYCLPFFYSP